MPHKTENPFTISPASNFRPHLFYNEDSVHYHKGILQPPHLPTWNKRCHLNCELLSPTWTSSCSRYCTYLSSQYLKAVDWIVLDPIPRTEEERNRQCKRLAKDNDFAYLHCISEHPVHPTKTTRKIQ